MIDTPFKVVVNEDRAFDVKAEEALELDVAAVGDGVFHVLKEHKAYRAEVVEANYVAKSIQMKINGNLYRVSIGDRYDQLVGSMGLSKVAAVKINEIKAPMPGLVLEISVAVGDVVQKGEKVLILEAMKMENVIKAVGDGVVKGVRVLKGAAVVKGEVLIDLE